MHGSCFAVGLSSLSACLWGHFSPAPDKTLVLNDAEKWTGSFTDLPENKEGQAITYTVVEVEPW